MNLEDKLALDLDNERVENGALRRRVAELETAARALARLVREENPSGLSLAEIAATWGDATDEEIHALAALRAVLDGEDREVAAFLERELPTVDSILKTAGDALVPSEETPQPMPNTIAGVVISEESMELQNRYYRRDRYLDDACHVLLHAADEVVNRSPECGVLRAAPSTGETTERCDCGAYVGNHSRMEKCWNDDERGGGVGLMGDRARIERAILKLLLLEPEAFAEKCDELRRYGLPSRSMAEGARSSETPIPVGPEGEMKDRVDRWLRDRSRLFDASLAHIENALRDLEAIQREVCVPISAEKARQALIDEEAGTHRFECYGCGQVFKRTAAQRPRSSRCRACFDWYVSNGRPGAIGLGTGKTPPEVIAARIERESRKKVKA